MHNFFRLQIPFHDPLQTGAARGELITPPVLSSSPEARQSIFVGIVHATMTVLLTIFLTGCMVGPDYTKPQVDVPQQWRFAEEDAAETAGTAWWKQFQDPVLNELIAVALQENKDVLIATARIEEFMGRYRIARSALFPQGGAEGEAGRERITEEGRSPVAGIKNPDDFYQGVLSGSWEVDLWGKLRRANESSRATLLSTEEARRGVILSLVAAVAGTYVDLRDFDRELEIARHTAETREKTLKIFKLRFDAGVISELELRQVESDMRQRWQ